MNYSGIKYCDMMNGDGLRTVLFVSGCSHHCPSCHNPQTHDPRYGHQFTIGTMTEIMESLRMEFCSGLTLSGGDPLYPDNRNEVMRIVETVKGEFGNEKTIWHIRYTGFPFSISLIRSLSSSTGMFLNPSICPMLNSPTVLTSSNTTSLSLEILSI